MANPARMVSPFEANLITIGRFLMHQPVPGNAQALIREKQPRPMTLSENAIHLLKDTLSKGCVLFLVRHGGWHHERFVKNEVPVTGRTWDRFSLGERSLRFQKSVLDFLIWLTCEKPDKPEIPWKSAANQPADDLFFAMALSRLAEYSQAVMLLRDRTSFAANGLARLVCPEIFATPNEFPAPDFSAWFDPPRVMMLEALQPWLTSRWLDLEFGWTGMNTWPSVREKGRSMEVTLEAYLAACRQRNRPDLMRFFLNVVRRVFAQGPRETGFWTGGLSSHNAPTRLADRLAVSRAALVLPRIFLDYASWMGQFRSVGYFDDGYQTAQMALADWEAADGERLREAARAAVSAIEPLAVP